MASDIENWLKLNKNLLSIRGIERELNCPDSLQKVVQGKRSLPKALEQKLEKLIKERLVFKKNV